jgi:hypothetical protein
MIRSRSRRLRETQHASFRFSESPICFDLYASASASASNFSQSRPFRPDQRGESLWMHFLLPTFGTYGARSQNCYCLLPATCCLLSNSNKTHHRASSASATGFLPLPFYYYLLPAINFEQDAPPGVFTFTVEGRNILRPYAFAFRDAKYCVSTPHIKPIPSDTLLRDGRC